MKKVLYTDFVTTESLVEVLLEKKEIKKAITRSNLYKFWDKVAGEKFAKRSFQSHTMQQKSGTIKPQSGFYITKKDG